jgi:hypothetical protein
MADIFISYSSDDKTIVKRLASLLERKGWSVWWDRNIPVGDIYDNVIEKELHEASCVLVIWTAKSVSSEWVKNEAHEAAQKGVLVPVTLERVLVPLAFKRVESAMLIGWEGEEEHPELEILYSSIDAIMKRKEGKAIKEKRQDIKTNRKYENDTKNIPSDKWANSSERPVSVYSAIAIVGFILTLFLVFYYLQYIQGKVTDEVDQRMFYLILVLFGISVSALVFGLMNSYAVFKGEKQNAKLKITGPAVGVMLVVLGGFYLPRTSDDKNVTIRVFDWKKNPVLQGDVKIYLKEYVRTQSVDKMGQALFTGIPTNIFRNKIKIEVSSPGYTTCSFDTLLSNSGSLELTLPLKTEVMISGRVKTAAEIPIRGVEINVEGTRYYALSITDGSYLLHLNEYTLGDEITLTTSHKDYEDKTIALKITSPDIINNDIFLNPINNKK